jgi:DNA-binding SARP family transcriptional activator
MRPYKIGAHFDVCLRDTLYPGGGFRLISRRRMSHQSTNLARLYLPLLADPQPLVRRQACLIMLGTYGERALTYLRRLIDDGDAQVREDARLALLSVAEITDSAIKLHSFRGMHVECLGCLRIYIGNDEVQLQDWAQAEAGRAGWQKVQGALAYLIHCGRRGASREALGAAVWGGAFSASSLARTLTSLRQALSKPDGGAAFVERAVVFDGDHCMLDPHYYHTDVQFFESAFNMATLIEEEQGLDKAAPLYTHAVQLYSGPYMAGVLHGSGWSRLRRDHLANSFMIAAERLAEHTCTRRQYKQCLSVCSIAIDADPTADEVVVWLLRAYAQAESYAELEHAYQSYLRAARLDAHSAEGQQDPVVRVYQSLGRAQTR